MPDELRGRELAGANAEPLGPEQAALWHETQDRLQRLAGKLARGEEVRRTDLELPPLDTTGVLNALHVPGDAGGWAADLERILRRIPDGWGRWIGTGPGWYALVADIDRRLGTLDPSYSVEQVKSKYGALCYYYYTTRRGDVSAAMDAVVDKAEELSTSICELCGRPGCLRVDRTDWYATLCPECARQGGYAPVSKDR